MTRSDDDNWDLATSVGHAAPIATATTQAPTSHPADATTAQFKGACC
jgi:hypothetical protein